MSPRPTSPRARQRAINWLPTYLIAAAASLGLGGLKIMVTYGTWIITVVALTLAVSTIIVMTRHFTGSRWVPSVVGAGAAVMLLMWTYGLRGDGSHHALPSPGAFMDLAQAVESGARYANASVIPVDVNNGFSAMVGASVLALFLVAEHLSVSWGLTATSGLALLLPWLPAAILQHQVSITLLVLAVACWIATMSLTGHAQPAGRPRLVPKAVAVSTAVLSMAVIIAPLALGGPGWGTIPRFNTLGGDGSTRLNLELDLRNSLTAQSGNPVLVYASSGARPDTFKLYTLTDFDGNSWDRAIKAPGAVPADAGVLWPTPVTDWETRDRDRLDIQVRALTERNLPLPSAPRTVDVDPSWAYFAADDEVINQSETTKDLTYSVVTDLDFRSDEDLKAAQASIDAGTDAKLDDKYLNVAPAIDLERVTTVATNVTQRATDRYGQAMALQQFLRNSLEFRYDTSVSPSGDDSVSEFLDARTGYCVQFATTMVTMARTLGIPSRLAVGFLGGEATDDGTYVVRGSDAHTWPELYFGDQGWVRFEPTPAVQTGAPPQYADPSTGVGAPVGSVPDGMSPGAAGDITNPVLDTSDSPGVVNTGVPLVVVWTGGLITAAALAVGWLWWWRRERGSHMRAHGPERAWDELRGLLEPLIGWPTTLTPLEVQDYVERHMTTLGTPLSEGASAALSRVTLAVSAARYGFAVLSHSDSSVNASTATGAQTSGPNGNEAGLVRDAREVSAEVQAAYGRTPGARRIRRST